MKYKFSDEFYVAKGGALQGETPSRESVRGGYMLLLLLAGWRLIPFATWEMLTTFIIYLPATDIHSFICNAVNRKWADLSNVDRQKVLAALVHLDKHGEISDVIDEQCRL